MAEQFVGPDVTGDGINDVDITGAGDFTVINGAIFEDAVRVGSGTGNYNTFLAISNNSGVESGFNSDDTPPIDSTNSDIDQAKTHTVLLSSLVQITVNGVQYYQIRLDLNEANSDPNAQISLDQFKIYSSSDGGIVSTTDLFTENLLYDMDAGGNKSILLSDAGSTGSGTDDYAFLIPVSDFAGLDPTTTYIYLYTQMGAADGADWNAGATFEEFNLENGVTLSGVKFSDLDGDGIRDAGEPGVGGVTIFIDSNQNGALDAGERTTVTASDGSYSFFGVALNQTLWIDEVTPAGAVQTTGAHEVVTIPLNAAPGSTIVVDPIGNHYLTPHISITKDATFDDGSDCADTPGELIDYTVSVTNDGELALSNVVVTDSFEGGSGVTITGPDSGDDNNNGLLDVGETWIYTYTYEVTQDDIDSNGGDDDGSLDNVASVNADSTNGSVSASDDAAAEVCQNPHVTLDKTASVDGDCADVAGELVNYSISVTNDGNVSLENVVVTDDFADSGSIAAVDEDFDGFNDGDTDFDGVLDVGETWLYTAFHAVTQDEIDAGGNYDSSDPADGINDSLRNVATATAEVVNSDTLVSDDDDAVVEVCQNPGVDLTKYVDVGFGWDDANTGPGPENVNVGGDVSFKITVENTGNVTLTDVDITDTYLSGGAPGTANLLVDNGVLTAYAIAHGASLTGDDGNGLLDVGETWEIIYTEAFDPLAFQPGAHLNTADVTDAQGAEDEDSAYYFSLVDTGLCPRTPGFWQNPNNGGQFWDGVVGNEKHAGEDGFPTGELLYAVDSNNDGVINGSDQAGLLIGDYNKDGLTDNGEDTLFVSYADARTLINASTKQLTGSSADGRYILGRDMVASWLNYLQGSGFGDASDPQSPHHYLDDSIDWMQIYSGTLSGGTTETFDKLKLSGSAIKTSSTIWKDVQSGFDHSASQMHSALDYYNNTGQTQVGGTHYANCCNCTDIFTALSVFESAHPELI
jgi:uncharacterized repeat protein (TIGR01451 family)